MSKTKRTILFRPMPRSLIARRRLAGAFTLLELMVSIAIIAVLAAGVAAIFSAVGDTVSAGKRVSVVNKYAQLMEGVIRADLERLTRDGFLVIRHELANDGDPVPLYRGDPNPRQRRMDELMFFARGDFASIRRPMVPGITARSNEARIWYGFGQRAEEDLSTLDIGSYLYPSLDDDNISIDTRLGWEATTAGSENPNRFASDWTLLRHLTLLATPSAGEARITSEPVYDINPATDSARRRLRDHEWQIGLQPAAQSVFRARLEHQQRVQAGGSIQIINQPGVATMLRQADHEVWPRFSSGLIDVASESLAEVRSVVTSAGLAPWVVQSDPAYFLPTGAFDPASIATRSTMRRWMLNALPGELTDRTADLEHPETLARMRYESVPPLLSIPDSEVGAGLAGERERAYREADQEMLAASAFIPRCTEFIVEWSFGWTYNDSSDPRFGQLQWYGLDRAEDDVNGDGDTDDPVDRVASFFTPMGAGPAVDGVSNRFIDPMELNRISQLVYGRPGTGLVPAGLTAQESVFGYFDPGNITDTSDANHANDDAEWPWPTMLRVTMSFADPTDPSVETTMQFIVELTTER